MSIYGGSAYNLIREARGYGDRQPNTETNKNISRLKFELSKALKQYKNSEVDESTTVNKVKKELFQEIDKLEIANKSDHQKKAIKEYIKFQQIIRVLRESGAMGNLKLNRENLKAIEEEFQSAIKNTTSPHKEVSAEEFFKTFIGDVANKDFKDQLDTNGSSAGDYKFDEVLRKSIDITQDISSKTHDVSPASKPSTNGHDLVKPIGPDVEGVVEQSTDELSCLKNGDFKLENGTEAIERDNSERDGISEYGLGGVDKKEDPSIESDRSTTLLGEGIYISSSPEVVVEIDGESIKEQNQKQDELDEKQKSSLDTSVTQDLVSEPSDAVIVSETGDEGSDVPESSINDFIEKNRTLLNTIKETLNPQDSEVDRCSEIDYRLVTSNFEEVLELLDELTDKLELSDELKTKCEELAKEVAKKTTFHDVIFNQLQKNQEITDLKAIKGLRWFDKDQQAIQVEGSKYLELVTALRGNQDSSVPIQEQSTLLPNQVEEKLRPVIEYMASNQDILSERYVREAIKYDTELKLLLKVKNFDAIISRLLDEIYEGKQVETSHEVKSLDTDPKNQSSKTLRNSGVGQTSLVSSSETKKGGSLLCGYIALAGGLWQKKDFKYEDLPKKLKIVGEDLVQFNKLKVSSDIKDGEKFQSFLGQKLYEFSESPEGQKVFSQAIDKFEKDLMDQYKAQTTKSTDGSSDKTYNIDDIEKRVNAEIKQLKESTFINRQRISLLAQTLGFGPVHFNDEGLYDLGKPHIRIENRYGAHYEAVLQENIASELCDQSGRLVYMPPVNEISKASHQTDDMTVDSFKPIESDKGLPNSSFVKITSWDNREWWTDIEITEQLVTVGKDKQISSIGDGAAGEDFGFVGGVQGIFKENYVHFVQQKIQKFCEAKESQKQKIIDLKQTLKDLQKKSEDMNLLELAYEAYQKKDNKNFSDYQTIVKKLKILDEGQYSTIGHVCKTRDEFLLEDPKPDFGNISIDFIKAFNDEYDSKIQGLIDKYQEILEKVGIEQPTIGKIIENFKREGMKVGKFEESLLMSDEGSEKMKERIPHQTFIINLGNTGGASGGIHFVCACVKFDELDPTKASVYYQDSLGDQPTPNIVKNLKDIGFKEEDIHYFKNEQQIDGWSCGRWAVANAIQLDEFIESNLAESEYFSSIEHQQHSQDPLQSSSA